MKNVLKFIITVLILCGSALSMNAQKVMIMSRTYTCEDPRGFDENATWTLKKGEAILVYPTSDGYEYYGGYTAASVILPKSVCRLPGSVRGERYIVINGTNLRLREKPSTSSGIYCYDSDYAGSVAQEQFLLHPEKELGVYGNSYSWKPYYLPKGTRLPYLGKVNGFYKTKFDGTVFYLHSKYCLLK